jgi:hypothetical protein
MNRYIPLSVTLLLFSFILAMQFWFIAAAKPAGYLIVCSILLLLAAAAVGLQVVMLTKYRD